MERTFYTPQLQQVGELALPLASYHRRKNEPVPLLDSTVELSLMAWMQDGHTEGMRVGELAPPLPEQSWRAGPGGDVAELTNSPSTQA